MENENTVIKLLYVELASDLNKKELLLQELINAPVQTNLHLACLDVLKEIVITEASIVKLDKMLGKE